MSEVSPTSSAAPATPPRKKRLGYFLLAGFVAAIGGAFVASQAGLDKALVKQQLDGFIAHAKEEGRAQGRDIDITYRDLSVVGGLTHKHVEVKDVVLVVKPLQSQPLPPGVAIRPDVMQVSTPVVAIYPLAADLSSLRAELPNPINFALQDAPNKSLLKITATVAPSITFTREQENGIAYNHVNYAWPPQVDFTYLRETAATGTEDATPKLTPVYETLRMEVAPGAAINTKLAADHSRQGSASIAFGQIVLTPQAIPEGAVTIVSVDGRWEETQSADGKNSMHVALNAGPLNAPPELLPYAPISLSLEANYAGANAATAEAAAQGLNQDATMTLKNFALTAKDAAIHATADFTASAADVLPVGKAAIELTNVPFLVARLRENGLIDPVRQELLEAGLQQITGTAVAELKDTTIAIERPKGEAFKIGKTTFEELFATFLKMALSHKPSASVNVPVSPAAGAKPVPHLPDPAKPKSQPIPLHDPSIRG